MDLSSNRIGRRADIEKIPSSSGLSSPETEPKQFCDDGPHTIKITPDRITVPEDMLLAFEEKGILEILRNRLGQGLIKQQTGECA